MQVPKFQITDVTRRKRYRRLKISLHFQRMWCHLMQTSAPALKAFTPPRPRSAELSPETRCCRKLRRTLHDPLLQLPHWPAQYGQTNWHTSSHREHLQTWFLITDIRRCGKRRIARHKNFKLAPIADTINNPINTLLTLVLMLILLILLVSA